METDNQAERRRFSRQSGDLYPLSIGRHSARLIDWSANGIGIQVREGIDGYHAGDAVKVSILSERTHGVAVFSGRINRIDTENGILGIEFVDEGRDAARFLVELLASPDGPGDM